MTPTAPRQIGQNLWVRGGHLTTSVAVIFRTFDRGCFRLGADECDYAALAL
jgi:hypothetical protein